MVDDNQRPRVFRCTASLDWDQVGAGGGVAPVELPYRLRDDFLSAAESSFYKVLAGALAGRAVVCPKVNLAYLFFVVRPNENQAFRNKIDRKHVDFVLCDLQTMRLCCEIELDDASHGRRERQERDAFVDKVFEAVGLALVRVPAQTAYHPASLLELVEPFLQNYSGGHPPIVQRPTSAGDATPICPKCGVSMIPRVAKRGDNAGRPFYGCPNYPRCKQVLSI